MSQCTLSFMNICVIGIKYILGAQEMAPSSPSPQGSTHDQHGRWDSLGGFSLAPVLLVPRGLTCPGPMSLSRNVAHAAGLVKPELSLGGVSGAALLGGSVLLPLHEPVFWELCPWKGLFRHLEGRISSCIESKLQTCLPFVAFYETLTLPK